MTIIPVNNPSTNPAENVERIKAAIAEANKLYLANPDGGQVTVQLGAGNWVVTGDNTNASVGAIELLSGVELTGTLGNDGTRQTIIKLEDGFDARLNGIVRTALDTVENVTISNLVIDGNRANNIGHQAGFICGVKEESGDKQTNITLDNVEARNCSAYGINPHEITYDLKVTNSTAHHNGLDGFVADGVVGGVYEGNISYANDRHGFNIQNASQNIVLENNEAHGNGTGATGGAGIVVQRGDIQRGNEPEIAHVTNVQIIGGEYYGNTREGILVKLSDNVTISGADIHDNMRQGVRIEGSDYTVLRDSFISNNSKETPGAYDEVQIRLREDYPDGDTADSPAKFPLKTYYSDGTQILNNIINPQNARYAIREEPTNDAGNAVNSVISGNATGGIATNGDDTLSGSAGVDTMAGGAGNDTYIVNKDGDVVTENVNEGTDHVFASAKHTLGANVENLTLTGSAAINGYGNELNNVLTGNAGANNLEGFGGADTLSGGGGNDTLQGGDGNDVYVVDNAGVLIVEKANGGLGGYDHVFASVDHTLAAQVEELTLTGTANLIGVGNTGTNTLNGNAGHNVLDGGGGADRMKGGLGNDTYYVDHTQDIVLEAAGEGIDTILSSISISAASPLTANVENLQLIDPINPGDPLTKWAIEGAGNQLSNLIVGNSAANKLYGYGGDDILRGGAGNDTLDGGEGNDTAQYSGNRANYTITGTGASRTVAGTDEGTDNVLNIEVLQFADGKLVGDVWVPNQDPPPANAVLSSATANLTETDAVLSTGGQLTITDPDSGEATFRAQSGTAGQYGTFGIVSNGQWTYVASSAHNGFVQNQVYTDSFEVFSFDGTRTTVTVNITGTNDAAVISGATAKAVTEGNTAAAISTSGTLTIFDADGAATFLAQSNVAGSNGYGKFTIGANGAWTYVADTAHNEFVAGQTYTDSITVAADGTTQVVTVTITGTNDGAVLSSAVVNLTETDAVLSTSGQLTITDPDSGEAVFRAQSGTAGQYGTFAIGANGQWTYVASSAHNEFVQNQVYTDSFEVFSADGTKTTVTVNITGTDEVAPPPNPGNPVVPRSGTARSETLNGRDTIDDVMKGLGGNDTIRGRGGNDSLDGGSGNDKVYGDSGDDRVTGSSGNDWVYGGTGNDYANGGSGNDKVYGNAGFDWVFGGSGHDTVDGGSGNDWVYGDSGNDRVYGGSGDDVVNGGSGNDRLYGNSGSDAFVFNSKLGTASTDRKVNFDTVVDLNVRNDSFLLDNAVFKKLGSGTLSNPTQLDAEFFTIGTKARERDDYLIYNKKTGVLSYDADGSGSRNAVEFAQLSKNLKLTYKDFFII
jgi:VCBS repeat-containing protein